MRNTIIIIAALIEAVCTLVILPIVWFYRPPWLVRRVERIANTLDVVKFRRK